MKHPRRGFAGAAAGVAAGLLGLVAWRQAKLVALRASRNWLAPGGVMHFGRLAVRRVGQQGPPVLLLHGMCASNLYWGHTFDSLGDDYRLLVPDLLGFGRSPKPLSGYSAAAHAAALADSLLQNGIHDPVLVAGHSMGTIAALALARFHPELVAGVVALAPPIFRNAADARRHVRAMGPVEGMMAFDPPARMFCRAMCAHREMAARLAPFLRPDLPIPVARDGVRHIWTSYSESLDALILDSPAPGWLPEIEVPVHFVAALDDPVTDNQFLAELAAAYGNVALTLWPAGGHDLPLSCTDQSLAAVESMAKHLQVGSSMFAMGDPGTSAVARKRRIYRPLTGKSGSR